MLLALRARGLVPLLRTTSAACSRCHHVAAKVRVSPAWWPLPYARIVLFMMSALTAPLGVVAGAILACAAAATVWAGIEAECAKCTTAAECP
jgi:uncharacterized paraquat-inducible protein A